MSLELKYNIMVLAVRRLINRVKMKDERKSNEMKNKRDVFAWTVNVWAIS